MHKCNRNTCGFHADCSAQISVWNMKSAMWTAKSSLIVWILLGEYQGFYNAVNPWQNLHWCGFIADFGVDVPLYFSFLLDFGSENCIKNCSEWNHPKGTFTLKIRSKISNPQWFHCKIRTLAADFAANLSWILQRILSVNVPLPRFPQPVHLHLLQNYISHHEQIAPGRQGGKGCSSFTTDGTYRLGKPRSNSYL